MKLKIATTVFVLAAYLLPFQSFAFRLNTIGFELNSTTNFVETYNNAGTIISTTVHGGNFAQETLATQFADIHFMAPGTGTSTAYGRVYFYVKSYPQSTSTIMAFQNTGQVTFQNIIAGIYMQPDGTMGMDYADGAGAATYSGVMSSAVSMNTWHNLELQSTSTSANAQGMVGRLDGVQFGTFTSPLVLAAGQASGIEWGGWLLFGAGETCTACDSTDGDMVFDDTAVNDTTGASQNTWPGVGQAILYVPNGAGDQNTWRKKARTFGDVNNWQSVNGVPPSELNMLFSSSTKDSDFYTVTSSTTLKSTDTVSLVQVWSRFNRTGTNPGSLAVQLKKASGGTISLGTTVALAGITGTSTNKSQDPYNPALTLYTDPDSVAWTSTTIGTMQIGATTTANALTTSGKFLTGVWAYVEYVPAAPVAPAVPPKVIFRGGFISFLKGFFFF